MNAAYTQDQLQAQTDKALYDLGVISGIAYSKSKNTADQLTTQHKLSEEQLEVNQKAIEVQLASPQTKIDQAKALLDLYQKQSAALQVRAGISGVLAPLPIRCRWASTSPREPPWPKSFSTTNSRPLCRSPRPRRATSRSASRPPSIPTTASFPAT